MQRFTQLQRDSCKACKAGSSGKTRQPADGKLSRLARPRATPRASTPARLHPLPLSHLFLFTYTKPRSTTGYPASLFKNENNRTFTRHHHPGFWAPRNDGSAGLLPDSRCGRIRRVDWQERLRQNDPTALNAVRVEHYKSLGPTNPSHSPRRHGAYVSCRRDTGGIAELGRRTLGVGSDRVRRGLGLGRRRLGYSSRSGRHHRGLCPGSPAQLALPALVPSTPASAAALEYWEPAVSGFGAGPP